MALRLPRSTKKKSGRLSPCNADESRGCDGDGEAKEHAQAASPVAGPRVAYLKHNALLLWNELHTRIVEKPLPEFSVGWSSRGNVGRMSAVAKGNKKERGLRQTHSPALSCVAMAFDACSNSAWHSSRSSEEKGGGRW